MVRLGGVTLIGTSSAGRGPQELGPSELRRQLLFYSSIDRHLGDRIHDPLKILRPDRLQARIGRRIHKVDGIRNTVLDSEFHRIEIVTERAAESERTARQTLLQVRRWWRISRHV